MRNILLFCLLATEAQATIQNVSVLGTSATQALIHYTAPNNSPCNVEVSESSTYLPLVYDVDSTKFTSASSDSRAGSITNGAERIFVAGKRSADVGLDGSRYSRALQTATQHYFRITCPTTGDQATGTFQTTSIPFGASYVEPEASDPSKPGSYAYPTLSSTDRTQQLVDPQTGLLIKRLNLPKDVNQTVTSMPLQVARGGGWNGLTNLSSADGQGATVSGSTSQLFLGLANGFPYSNYQNWTRAAYQNISGAFGYFQVHLIAAVNPGGRAPSNPDDASILVCLTKDGATCYAGSSQYQAQLTTSYADHPFGTTNSIDLWQATAAATLPNWSEQAIRNGAVYCDGSSNVLQTGGAVFATNWGAGSDININGADYTISQVVHTAQLTLASNCPAVATMSGAFDQNTQTFRTSSATFQASDVGLQIAILGAGGGTGPWFTTVGQVIDSQTIVTNDSPSVTGVTTQFGFTYAYTGVNFGVLVTKKTASSDTISIDYATVNFEMDMYAPFVDEGGLELCGKNAVTGPNGRPGYTCILPSDASMYWIDQNSGETHFMGLPVTSSPYTGCGGEGQIHDLTNPDKIYCEQNNLIYAVTYYGNHSEPTSINANGSWGLFQSFPNCNTSQSLPPYTSQQPCVVVAQLTPGTNLITLAGAFSADPAYAPALDTVNFTVLVFHVVDDAGNMLFSVTRGGQDTLGWDFVFNPTATSNVEGGTSSGPLNNHGCVGGGTPGCVIAAAPGWARPGCRWCQIKDVTSPYPGWAYTGTYGWTNSAPGSGPYYVPVVDGTPNGTLNYLDGSTSLINCPPNTFGATGMNCSTLTVGSEPLSPVHGAGETGLPGEVGIAQVGDRFATQSVLPIAQVEEMTLIKKVPGAVAGTWVYTLWRLVNSANAHYATTGANPPLYTICAANQVLAVEPASSAWFWDFIDDPHGMNTTGNTIPPNPTSSLAHLFLSHGNVGYDAVNNLETRCASSYCYSTVTLGNRPFVQAVESPAATGVQMLNPTFAIGSYDATSLQSHPTDGGVSAPADRFSYMFDGRPYYGGYSSGSVQYSGSNPAALVAGQLYKFPQTSMPNLDLPFRKIYPTTAFSGQVPLADISSPATGNVIGTGTSDSYKYCVAAAVNECRQGSAVGDVYVNAPYVRYPYCYIASQNGNLTDEYDICIAGSPSVRDAITQTDMTAIDNEGRAQRILTKYRRARVINVFDTPYVVPNGQWMIFEGHFVGDASLNKSYFVGKIPPPDPSDSYNRLDFIPISISLPAVSGATQAFVRFGYAEFGASTSLFCTTRQESCVIGSPTSAKPVNSGNPFFFEKTEAGSWSAAACSSGCTINLPGIPQRVMYYQFVYMNGSTVVYTSPVSTTMVP
jgi:hypothetical protein